MNIARSRKSEAHRFLIRMSAVLVLCSVGVHAQEFTEADRLRVMTFNIWRGGVAGGEPLERTVEVIRAARADVVGMQESLGRSPGKEGIENGARIAQLLGWHYAKQDGGRAILSRFDIVGIT